MNVCKNCGVELEADMQICPLCESPVDSEKLPAPTLEPPYLYHRRLTFAQRKFTREIISLVLLCAIAATVLINFIIDKKITWAEYPVAVCLIIFSYLLSSAFLQQRTIIQLMAGLVLASVCIVGLDAITGGIQWALTLSVPILLAATIIVILLVLVVGSSRQRGVDLIAWAFLAAAVLCLCIDGILSYHRTQTLKFGWSIIVALCVIPVILVLLFVYFRLKKGKDLKRTFHV